MVARQALLSTCFATSSLALPELGLQSKHNNKEDFVLIKDLPILATGRRKSAVAQVKLLKGAGNLTINGRTETQYFQKSDSSNLLIQAPFNLVGGRESYDLIIKVEGGGLQGQAEAIKLGVSRALCEVENSYREVLKPEGFLTRDSRSVERKKYGLKKARKASQFSKR